MNRSILLALLLTATVARAQVDAWHGFRRFTAGDGLSQGTVTSLLQDRKGFIWIGTQDGLNRFDGIEFRTWRHIPGDTTSLGDSWITALHEDDAGRLWVGTIRGLYELDRRTMSFRRYAAIDSAGRQVKYYTASSIRSRRGGGPGVGPFLIALGISAVDRRAGRMAQLSETSTGVVPRGSVGREDVWLWRRGGLCLVDSTGLGFRRVADLGEATITAAIHSGVSSPDEVLVGTALGLYSIDPSTGGAARIAGVPAVRVIRPFGGGRFLIGSADGLWIIGPAIDGPVRRGGHAFGPPARAGLEGMIVLSACIDSAGTVWAGSHSGLYRQQTSTPVFSVLRHRDDNRNSLASDFVMPILEDRSGRIWFGTFDRGISIMSRDSPGAPGFTHHSRESGAGHGPRGNNIRSMIQSRDGMVWIGTDAGLTVCEAGPGFLSRYDRVQPGDSSGFWVDALFESRDGTLWAGATPSRLVRVDRTPGTRPSFVPFPLMRQSGGAPSLGVNAIVEGGGGELWVGAEAGFFRFEPATGSVEHFVHDPDDTSGMSHTTVWSLLVDTVDGREVLWVGTSQGLNRFEPSARRWTSYLRQDGFPSDWIYGIVKDLEGRLWLTTNHGITCFDDRKPAGRKFRNYDITDGIAGNECNRRSILRLRNGDILFGGITGVTGFDPRKISDNPNPPPVVLTAVWVGGGPADLDTDVAELRELLLTSEQNDVSFEFAALDFTNPLKNEYAYMLEGLDRGWNHIGNRRSLSYAGLEPGEYVLRVRASNNDGVWNDEGISVRLAIRPPFWRTWWFRISVVALVALTVAGVFRVREHRAREILAIRRRIARDLHDEIGSNLTGIAVTGSLLRDDGRLTAEQDERVSTITSIAVKTSELMRDLVWVIRPENDRLDDLCFRMKDAAGSILGGMKCRFTMPDAEPPRVLDLEVKHNLYLVYKEIITNIARHARASEVEVRLGVADGELTLRVADDGVGFDPGKASPGSGLRNIASRAAAVRGTSAVRSSPGGGTTVTVTVPFT